MWIRENWGLIVAGLGWSLCGLQLYSIWHDDPDASYLVLGCGIVLGIGGFFLDDRIGRSAKADKRSQGVSPGSTLVVEHGETSPDGEFVPFVPESSATTLRVAAFRDKLLGISVNPPCPLPICDIQELIGCTEAEVAKVEAVAGFPLPAEYRAFLLLMGRRAGVFMACRPYRVFFPALLTIDKDAKTLHPERFDEPDKVFVFLSYDGEGYFFFRSDEGDNPPIYGWGGGRFAQTQRLYDSIWDMLGDDLNNYA